MGFLFPFLRAKDLRMSSLIMRTRIFFYSPVRRGYICKVSVHLVQKYLRHDCSTDSISCSKQGGKGSDEKNIKTRQLLDKDNTVLLLATWKQGKSTLCCRFQSIKPVIDPLTLTSLSLIPWTRRLSYDNTSSVVVVVFVLVFLLQRLHRCRIILRPVV